MEAVTGMAASRRRSDGQEAMNPRPHRVTARWSLQTIGYGPELDYQVSQSLVDGHADEPMGIVRGELPSRFWAGRTTSPVLIFAGSSSRLRSASPRPLWGASLTRDSGFKPNRGHDALETFGRMPLQRI